MNHLNHQEWCTILAALRVFQRVRAIKSPDDCWKVERMEHFEGTKPLTDRQVDALCDRIATARKEVS